MYGGGCSQGGSHEPSFVVWLILSTHNTLDPITDGAFMNHQVLPYVIVKLTKRQF